MDILIYISDYIVPFIILSIVVYGIINGVNVYGSFIKGAKSGFLTVIRLMPTLIGLMAAVGILRASGFLDFIADVIGQFSGMIGFPGELVPLTIVKMFSSSAATGLLLDIFKEFGTDSRIDLPLLYRNDLLYHERLFHDCRGQTFPLHIDRSAARYIYRTCSKRVPCGSSSAFGIVGALPLC